MRGWPRIAKRLEFGGDLGGLGRPDALEYLQCLPQEYLGLRGVAGGHGSAKPLPIRLRREAARQDSKAGMDGHAAEAHKMKGISILVERLYSGYESGKRRAMRRSSTMAL
jgi:hypothetical protein